MHVNVVPLHKGTVLETLPGITTVYSSLIISSFSVVEHLLMSGE